MGYFPIYLSLKDRNILIIGGGNIARDKLQKLLPFSSNITLIAMDFIDDIESIAEQNSLKLIKKEYQKGDIEGFDIIISAIDNLELQREIYYEAKKRQNFGK